ncbi:hypothetical protein D3227_33320 [Mesorhizobium waimense]|uniref:Uncharacterized protein n=1 Tax=Mesorhizobium waimense TaxID=1300307 RepID=A0A3A5K8J7_9HYPH|nr:hypothetical protein D3227_33320 [Mesorhizobium waimense]
MTTVRLTVGAVLRFPQSRVSPVGAKKPAKILGLGPMATVLGAPEEQTIGHWCSRCRGIWYGYLLEVACPVCGNRHG